MYDILLESATANRYNRMAKEGMAIITSSSEMPELIGITDRLLVFYHGKIVKYFDRKDYDEITILKYVTGVLSDSR